MREILFRGKAGPIWVAGYLLVWPSGQMEICAQTPGEEAQMHKMTVYPETVGQFTGLADKNGKKIFEGDVIKRFWLGGELLYRVIYESDCARFIGKCINRIGFTTIEGDGDCFEVIGNIYDNPELLEGHQ